MATGAVLRVVTSYGDRTLAVRQRVLRFIERTWGDLSSWRDADIERFVKAVVPVVTGGQIQIAALTDSYLAAIEAAATGLPARPVGIPAKVVSDKTMRGVATADVYRRTGPSVWYALSRGIPIAEAARIGLSRALALGATDMQLAKTHASRHVLAGNKRVTGYRRVLGGGHSCSLCVSASNRSYGKGDLLPIHPGCSCSVVAVYATSDPGQVGDRGADGEDRGQPVVQMHGELGPVLASKSWEFRSADDLP